MNRIQEFMSTLPKFNVSFTTPSLDFKDHCKELEKFIDQLYEYKTKLQTFSKAESILDSKKPIMVLLVFEFLVRFNTLTEPTQRKSTQT